MQAHRRSSVPPPPALHRLPCAAAPAATPESVREEVDAIINATAIALGSVRDAATAETVASTLKELSERLDAVKRS